MQLMSIIDTLSAGSGDLFQQLKRSLGWHPFLRTPRSRKCKIGNVCSVFLSADFVKPHSWFSPHVEIVKQRHGEGQANSACLKARGSGLVCVQHLALQGKGPGVSERVVCVLVYTPRELYVVYCFHSQIASLTPSSTLINTLLC